MSISIEARHIAVRSYGRSLLKFLSLRARTVYYFATRQRLDRSDAHPVDYSKAHTMAGFGGALPGGIGEMAKSLGLDNLDDLDKAMAPAPAPDALPPTQGRPSTEVVAGEEAIKPEGWWHPKAAGDQAPPAANDAEPEKLASAKRQEHVETVPFPSFALSDEGKRVVLYFGLPNAMELLGENGVVATVRVQALEVVARVGNTAYRFHESILFEHVVPAKTKVRVKKDRVVVSMLKVFEKALGVGLGE